MPKLKTKSGAKKRFKLTKNGKIKCTRANRRHILEFKATKTKRRLRSATYIAKCDEAAIKQMMPYA